MKFLIIILRSEGLLKRVSEKVGGAVGAEEAGEPEPEVRAEARQRRAAARPRGREPRSKFGEFAKWHRCFIVACANHLIT